MVSLIKDTLFPATVFKSDPVTAAAGHGRLYNYSCRDLERFMDKISRPQSAEDLRLAVSSLDKNSEETAAKTGRLSARVRLLSLFDEGSFVETQKYLRRSATEFDDSAASDFEGVICGYGSVCGRLVFAFSQDFSRMSGALDAAHAKKISDLYEMAKKNGAPVVGIFDSAGACVMEGVSALAGYGKIMKAVSSASGIIPQVALIPGVCAGSAAAIAAMFDAVVISSKNCKLFVNSPFIVGDEVAKADFAEAEGLASIVTAEEPEAIGAVRNILSLLPSNNAEGTVYTGATDENTQGVAVAYVDNIKDLILSLSDDGLVTELSAGYGKEMVTALARLGGAVVGIVANDHSVNAGALTPAAARKAARFVNLCDSFNIPVLTLVDTEGLEVSAEAESRSYAAELAKLASAFAASETAKVTVVLGEAYGAAYTVMGSKSIGADMVYALDGAKIGVMKADRAVEFAWKDKVFDAEDPQSARKELEAEWNATLSSPAEAAARGEVDDIIAADELKPRICAAFEMLGSKSEAPLYRRHSNYPL